MLVPDMQPLGMPLTLTTEDGIETVPLTIAGYQAHATLDLGNRSRPMVSEAFAEAAGLLVGRALGAAKGGGLGGKKALRTIKIDGVRISHRRLDGVEFRSTRTAAPRTQNI